MERNKNMRHSWEDGLLILWVVYCGFRYVKGPKFEVYNPKPETTASMFHRDQIYGREKCTAREEERTFVFLRVSADIHPAFFYPTNCL